MELGDYSSRFLAALVGALPKLGEQAPAGSEDGGFTVTFLTPSGATGWVTTEEFGRVTVGSGSWHAHFGGWADSVDAHDFEQAIGCIRRLMAGENGASGDVLPL
ncbi:hypothetical protein R5W24_000403 [Gemmata sp. JC717]|uniref:hypothetical protein n=1 Tax=Gemmata algarum TaxID=2975278 RepID=UPI0021BB7535|nr:hypothetical protein [Gemmata algarum]MDY3551328.1 hypothetical protein [Gemmata algarum]